jgi:hypothetical protein
MSYAAPEKNEIDVTITPWKDIIKHGAIGFAMIVLFGTVINIIWFSKRNELPELYIKAFSLL